MISVGMRLYANRFNLKHLNAARGAARLCFLLSGETNQGRPQSEFQPCQMATRRFICRGIFPGGVKESACLPIPVKYVLFDWFEFCKTERFLSLMGRLVSRRWDKCRSLSSHVEKMCIISSPPPSVPTAASSNNTTIPDQHELHGQIRTAKLYSRAKKAENKFSPAAPLNQLILTKDRVWTPAEVPAGWSLVSF